MKKWLVGGVLTVLVLLFLVAPFLVGLGLERGFPVMLERAQAQGEGRYALEGSFSRGLLSSQSETVVRFSPPGPEGSSLRLRQSWLHGPFAVPEWLEGRFPFPPVIALVRNAVESGAGRPGGGLLAEVLLRVNLDGSLDLEAGMPAFELPARGLRSGGASAKGSFQGGIRGGRGHVELAELQLRVGASQMDAAPTTVRFHGVSNEAGSRVDGTFDLGVLHVARASGLRIGILPSFGTFEASRAPNELDLSALETEVGEIEIAQEDSSAPIVVRGGRLRLRARTTAGRLVRMGLSFSLDSLERGEESYGPGLVRLQLRGVDLLAVSRLRDALAELQVSSADAEPEARAQAETRLLHEWIPVLMASSPELELERLELEGPDGIVEARGRLEVDGRDPAVFEGETTAMEAIEARGYLLVPAPLLHGWLDSFLGGVMEAEAGALPAEELAAMTVFLREMTVARLLDEGMLRPSGDRYRVEMRFEQGVFIVNGKPLGPGGLSGLMGGG